MSKFTELKILNSVNLGTVTGGAVNQCATQYFLYKDNDRLNLHQDYFITVLHLPI